MISITFFISSCFLLLDCNYCTIKRIMLIVIRYVTFTTLEILFYLHSVISSFSQSSASFAVDFYSIILFYGYVFSYIYSPSYLKQFLLKIICNLILERVVVSIICQKKEKEFLIKLRWCFDNTHYVQEKILNSCKSKKILVCLMKIQKNKRKFILKDPLIFREKSCNWIFLFDSIRFGTIKFDKIYSLY